MDVSVVGLLEAWPPDAMWCEAEESAQAPRVTRQQARLEAVEKLQDAWRRLKRDEKVPARAAEQPMPMRLAWWRLDPDTCPLLLLL